MTLDEVVRVVYEVLREPDIETHRNYPGRTVEKYTLIRESYIEAQLFPDLPLRAIVRRRITGLLTVEESTFWERVLKEARH